MDLVQKIMIKNIVKKFILKYIICLLTKITLMITVNNGKKYGIVYSDSYIRSGLAIILYFTCYIIIALKQRINLY